MAGIGGTGVSTVSAIIVMGCRIENKWAQTMNFTGLAQKNGAVTSQVRISSKKHYTKNLQDFRIRVLIYYLDVTQLFLYLLQLQGLLNISKLKQ